MLQQRMQRTEEIDNDNLNYLEYDLNFDQNFNQKSENASQPGFVETERIEKEISDAREKLYDSQVLKLITKNLKNVGGIFQSNLPSEYTQTTVRSNFLEGTERMPEVNQQLIKIYHFWFQDEIIDQLDSSQTSEGLDTALTGLKSPELRTRVGSLCHLYKLLFLEEDLSLEETKNLNTYLLSNILPDWQNIASDLELYILLELLYFIGDFEQISKYTKILSFLIISKRAKIIKEQSLRILFSLDFYGISEILNLLNSKVKKIF